MFSEIKHNTLIKQTFDACEKNGRSGPVRELMSSHLQPTPNRKKRAASDTVESVINDTNMRSSQSVRPKRAAVSSEAKAKSKQAENLLNLETNLTMNSTPSTDAIADGSNHQTICSEQAGDALFNEKQDEKRSDEPSATSASMTGSVLDNSSRLIEPEAWQRTPSSGDRPPVLARGDSFRRQSAGMSSAGGRLSAPGNQFS